MRIILLTAALASGLVYADAGTLTTITPDSGIDQPFGLRIGPDGALYFCDVGKHQIDRLDLKSRKVSVVAGTGEKGYGGDGGPAAQALMDEPYEIAFDKGGNLFFCDRTNHVVRRIDRKTRVISTVAGTGKEGFGGDGGPAAQAQFRQPHSIAFAPDGRLLICDILNFRIRAVDFKSGGISTWAGTGQRGSAADGAPLTGTPLDGPRALAIDKAGNFYLALREGNAIYRLDVKGGKMYRFAGTGEKGFTGDGGDARLAKLSGPKGVACAPDGSLYIADTENHAIRKVDARGVITTVAGDGKRGALARPHGVYVDRAGVLYIADTENHRVLMMPGPRP